MLAREAGLHPELVAPLRALGLLEPRPARDRRRASRATRRRAWRAPTRLRRDLGLNYAGAVLALELLDRIDRAGRAAAPLRASPTARGDDMDPNRLTQKSRRRCTTRRPRRCASGTPRSTASTCCSRCSTSPRGWSRGCWRGPASTPARCSADARAAARAPAARQRAGARPGEVRIVTQRSRRLLDAAEQEAKRLKDEYVSVEHLLLALLAAGTADGGRAAAARARRHPRALPRGADRRCAATSG